MQVLLFGSEGVVCSSFERTIDVTFDASGRAELRAEVALTPDAAREDAPPTSVVAQVTHAGGLVEETHCALGGETARDGKRDPAVRQVGGERVRITPSAPSPPPAE